MAGIQHAFTNPKADGADATVTRPSDWNAPHLVDGLKFGAGTAFPGSPATGDRFYRTDILGGTAFKYDGTRWRSTQTFTHGLSTLDASVNAGITASQNFGRATIPFAGTYGLYVLSTMCTTFVATTNNGTNFWTIRFRWGNAAGTFTDLSSFSTGTAPDTASTYVYHEVAVNAVMDVTAVTLSGTTAFTLSPGLVLVMGGQYTYQIIAT